MTDDGEARLTEALDQVAAAAEHAAREHQRVATAARDLAHASREAGEPASSKAGQLHLIVGTVGRTGQHLAHQVLELRRAWARVLLAQGWSVRRIGEHFGVSHQRISALLNGRRGSAGHGPGGPTVTTGR